MLAHEIPWREPAELFRHWQHEPWLAWLDSGGAPDVRSRYAYLAIEPFQLVTAQDGITRIGGTPVDGDPFAVMERELARWQLPTGSGPTPFVTGALGFFGYELARHLEHLALRHPNDLAIPDMAVGFYDVVIAFDRMERRTWILSSGFPEGKARAQIRLDAMIARLAQPVAPAIETSFRLDWQPELPRKEYEYRVAQVLDHIRAGDIYQANFTARYQARRPAGIAAPALYRALRETSPAPFGAYLACGPSLAIASASPERFLSLDSRDHVETRPIKGTRPRGATSEQDRALRHALAASVKDRAENLMIVDLMRHDVGRVCEVGTVEVPALCEVETFARVHHLVSVVTGQLRPGIGPIGLLRATFPGGSVTGAPKIRAMQIIDALEQSRRGIYCGCIAWIGFDGAMDASIVIRTLTIASDTVVAQAGGGIVADSDPAAEYDEMLVKITPLLIGSAP